VSLKDDDMFKPEPLEPDVDIPDIPDRPWQDEPDDEE